MDDKHDHSQTNGTALIPQQHQDVRRRFVKLWNQRTCGEEGEPTLDAAWQALANLLENHPAKERDVENF